MNGLIRVIAGTKPSGEGAFRIPDVGPGESNRGPAVEPAGKSDIARGPDGRVTAAALSDPCGRQRRLLEDHGRRFPQSRVEGPLLGRRTHGPRLRIPRRSHCQAELYPPVGALQRLLLPHIQVGYIQSHQLHLLKNIHFHVENPHFQL